MSTEPTGGAVDLVLRPGVPQDADALAALMTSARHGAVPAMPPPVHTPQEDRAWIGRQLAGETEAWVAERDGELVGYVLLEPGFLHSLYVRPDLTGRGIGTVLLDLVKSLRSDGFALWVFESNTGARRFYARHGLWELEHTDGSANEERAPDVRMVWPGHDPVAWLRDQVAEVDAELARVLARRAALTAALRAHEEVPGKAGRSPSGD